VALTIMAMMALAVVLDTDGAPRLLLRVGPAAFSMTRFAE